MKQGIPLLAGWIAATVLASIPAHAQVSQETGAYAIVGAKIEIGDGRTLEKGTILLRNGLIEAVGTNVTVPPDAEVIKGDGLVAYPGFIDAYASNGLTLPGAEADQDKLPDTNALAPAWMREANRKGIRSELRAAELLTLTDAILSPWRAQGFTTAWIAPSGGMINGVGALVNLSGEPRRDSIVSPAAGMNFAFSSGGGGFGRGARPAVTTPAAVPARETGTGYPGSLLGIIALTRQTLLDARYLQTCESHYAKAGGARPPTDDSLAALQPVLNGTIPAVYNASTENEIVRAERIAEEFHLHLIVSGGIEAWKQTDLLASKHIPVLLSLDFGDDPTAPRSARGASRGGPGIGSRPGFGGGQGFGRRRQGAPGTPNNPPDQGEPPAAVNGNTPNRPAAGDVARNTPATQEEEDDTPVAAKAEMKQKWQEKTANAARLQKAGVLFAFSTQGSRGQADFWKNLRVAIQAGLPREAALTGLSLNAARILGMEHHLGTIETGKIANITLMTGDFTSAASKVKYLIIDRSKFEPDKDVPARPGLPAAPPADDDDEKGQDDGK